MEDVDRHEVIGVYERAQQVTSLEGLLPLRSVHA